MTKDIPVNQARLPAAYEAQPEAGVLVDFENFLSDQGLSPKSVYIQYSDAHDWIVRNIHPYLLALHNATTEAKVTEARDLGLERLKSAPKKLQETIQFIFDNPTFFPEQQRGEVRLRADASTGWVQLETDGGDTTSAIHLTSFQLKCLELLSRQGGKIHSLDDLARQLCDPDDDSENKATKVDAAFRAIDNKFRAVGAGKAIVPRGKSSEKLFILPNISLQDLEGTLDFPQSTNNATTVRFTDSYGKPKTYMINEGEHTALIKDALAELSFSGYMSIDELEEMAEKYDVPADTILKMLWASEWNKSGGQLWGHYTEKHTNQYENSTIANIEQKGRAVRLDQPKIGLFRVDSEENRLVNRIDRTRELDGIGFSNFTAPKFAVDFIPASENPCVVGDVASFASTNQLEAKEEHLLLATFALLPRALGRAASGEVVLYEVNSGTELERQVSLSLAADIIGDAMGTLLPAQEVDFSKVSKQLIELLCEQHPDLRQFIRYDAATWATIFDRVRPIIEASKTLQAVNPELAAQLVTQANGEFIAQLQAIVTEAQKVRHFESVEEMVIVLQRIVQSGHLESILDNELRGFGASFELGVDAIRKLIKEEQMQRIVRFAVRNRLAREINSGYYSTENRAYGIYLTIVGEDDTSKRSAIETINNYAQSAFGVERLLDPSYLNIDLSESARKGLGL